jgi:hypothetical protein
VSTVYLNEFGISFPFIAKEDLEGFMVWVALPANVYTVITTKSYTVVLTLKLFLTRLLTWFSITGFIT